jgi:hypothetical protein
MKGVVICVALGLASGTAAPPIAFPQCRGQTMVNVPAVTATGDDDVIAFSAVILENEAKGGSVAYCLSDAQMTNDLNGLSFGFMQYDLKSNKEAPRTLARLLTDARAADPSLQVTDTDIAQIQSGALSDTAHHLKASHDVELSALIHRVNAALSSPAGKAATDREYVDSLKAKVGSLNKRIGELSDEVGARTYSRADSLGRLLLLDYEHFFGDMVISSRGFSAAYHKSSGAAPSRSKATRHSRTSWTSSSRPSRGPAARDERAEILRRINNVVKLHVGTVKLSEGDRTYLTTKLKPIIDGTDNPSIKDKRRLGEYDVLAKLVNRAETR